MEALQVVVRGGGQRTHPVLPEEQEALHEEAVHPGAGEEAFRWLRDLASSRGARLIVVGLDDAFTVDEDVRLQHIPATEDVDLALPLQRIGNVLRGLDIPFVNALPPLRDAARSIGGKIYNGPPGNSAGHLEPAGEEVLARLAANTILGVVRSADRPRSSPPGFARRRSCWSISDTFLPGEEATPGLR